MCIDGRAIADCNDFATNVVAACQTLVFALGIPCLQRRLGISTSLEEAMETYSEGGRQGYLILNEMDEVIKMQRTFELEGPLRSGMQIHDDVAVVIVASNDTINGLVGD